MRILLFFAWEIDVLGGAETSVMDLAEGFVKGGHNAAILELSDEQAQRQLTNEVQVWSIPRVGYPVLRHPRSLLPLLRSASQFNSVVRKFNPDIVSVHLPVLQSLPLVVARELPHTWLLTVTLHGSDVRFWPTVQPRLKPLQRRLLRRADAVTAVSESLRREAISLYPFLHNKVTVIHNGVRPFCAQHEVNRGSNEQEPYVLFVGRLHAIKGVDTLLRAWVRVRQQVSGVMLYLVGEGPELQNLMALSEQLHLNESVRFLGRKQPEELPDLYRRAQLVAMPSRDEALPLVALEAGSCGAICVGTNVGGMSEIIRDGVTGFLVAPDPNAIADTIINVLRLSDEMKRRISVAAQQRIRQHFAREKIVSEYVELFDALSRRRFRTRNSTFGPVAREPARLGGGWYGMLTRRLDSPPDYSTLPLPIRAEHNRDSWGVPRQDPGVEAVIEKGIAWLQYAQDSSSSRDGGVASHYSLFKGWSDSYPETTGYIVPTMIAYARRNRNESVRERAKQMLDWLISIQLPEGGFQGGLIGKTPVVPVTFNTGQILLGLACGVEEFGEEYRKPMRRAADWLVNTQDPDGCWRKHPSPFTTPGEKTYEIQTSWGLLQAARVDSNSSYADAALANISWALNLQKGNGWFENCCLSDPSEPLTHTIGYALRGVVEAYRFTNDELLMLACRRTADGLLGATERNGFLPGRLNRDWRGTVTWACLTGSAQIACCWLLLYKFTGDLRYQKAASAINRFLRRTVKLVGPRDIRGGLKGSFPISGDYFPYAYPSWGCKFLIDSNLFEQEIRSAE